MKTQLEKELEEVFADMLSYWIDGELQTASVIYDIRKQDPVLMKALLQNDTLREAYTTSVAGVTLFKTDEFIEMLRYKNYLPNSYTKFSNEVGLTSNGKYLNYNSDVVIDFPYKDGLLEGGMTTEDEKRDNEVYYHETLAREEIDVMLSPKVLSNVKKYTAKGVEEVDCFSDKDNLILKGNNLIALSALKERYAGKVKQVFIDVPYFFEDKKKDDAFGYNSNFKMSTWLTFLQNRIEAAYELLTSDGSLWITIDDGGAHYLKVLCDSVFGMNNFMSTIVWRSSDNSNNDAKRFSQDHNYIFVYSKSEEWRPKKISHSLEQSKHYKNPDDDPRGPWFDGNPIGSPHPRPNLTYDVVAPNGNIIKPPANGWRWGKSTMEEKMNKGEIRFNKDFTNIKRRTYLEEQEGIPASTLWFDLAETGHNRQAKYEQRKLFPDRSKEEWFSTPKPEKLLQRILHLGSNEGDLVLDFFMGSATTQAVAMKMKRQFIGVEQMDYIETVSVPRLQKVMEGEQGGISKDVEWTGGGSFVYAELCQLNQSYVYQVEAVKNENQLKELLDEIMSSAFFNYQVKIEAFVEENGLFATLSLTDKKRALLESLDANQLYLSYSEIEDASHAIDERTKRFNKSFYEGEGSHGGQG